MLLYLIVAILTYIILFYSKKIDNKRILIIISFLLLFLVSALRVNVGTDYLSYKEWFDNTHGPSLEYANFLFNNLIFLIKIFTNNSQVFFAVTSFIILSLVYYTNVKNNKEYDMSLYLFVTLGFYFSTFNGIRQWISIALFMLAYNYSIKKDYKKYFLLIIIASLFHVSALLLIPFYFIFNVKFTDKIKMYIIGSCLIFFKIFNIQVIIEFLLKHFAITYYWRYISSGVDLTKGVGSPFSIILAGGMFIYYILFKKYFIEKMDIEKYEQNKHLCFIIIIFAILNTVNNLFSRFALYFIPLIITLLPDFYVIYDKKWQKYIKILIIIVGLIFLTVNTLLKNSNGPLPYNSIFGYIGNI